MGPGGRRIGLDLSLEMLRSARIHARTDGRPAELLRGDVRRSPVRPGAARLVAVLGNSVGFAGPDATRVLESAAAIVAPSGRLVVETAPGDGERSRYLARLPPGAVRRLLAAPVNLIRARIEREGFVPVPRARTRSGFQRMTPAELTRRLRQMGFVVREATAVAPSLGTDPLRIAAVRTDPSAWRRLLEVEEAVGRSASRQPSASALLVAAERTEVDVALGRTDVLSKRR